MKISRQQLARYAADQLLAGQPASKIAKQLAAELVVSHRTRETDMLADDIAYELETRGELAFTSVVTAHELSPKLKAEIKAFVAKAVRTKDVVIDSKLDPEVLGGVYLSTATKAWDQTVRRSLSQIRKAAAQ